MCCIKHRTINLIKSNKDIIIIFLIFLVPRLISLGSDISNYDASYWYPRMDSFWLNLTEGKAFLTYQKYHPGVMLLWIAGFSKYVYEYLFQLVFGYSPRFYAEQFVKLQIGTLLPLMIILSGIGALWYYYLSKIVNKTYAAIFCILLSIEPFFLGISKFVHVTAPAAFFIFTSFLSLYYYLSEAKIIRGKHSEHSERASSYYLFVNSNKKHFYLSALFLGFALLTKIDSLIIGIFNAGLITYHFRSNLKLLSQHLMAYALIPLITFYLLFPAMWISAYTVINKIIDEGIKDNAFDSTGADTILGIRAFYYLEVFFYRTLPTTFIAFAISPAFFKKIDIWDKSKKFFIVSFAALAFLIILLTIPEKIKDRYLFNMLPFFLLFTSITFYYVGKLKKRLVKYTFLFVTFFWVALTVYRYHPVYSFYHSDLIGGASGINRFGMNVPNRGEYYAQTAFYLNSLSDRPQSMVVLVDHREQTRTFAPFFYGKTFTNPNTLPDGVFANYILTRRDFDYLVPRDKCKLLKTFGPKNPFGYDVIKAYECDGIDRNYEDFKN